MGIIEIEKNLISDIVEGRSFLSKSKQSNGILSKLGNLIPGITSKAEEKNTSISSSQKSSSTYTTSSSSLSDLMKMSYKEIYAFYKVAGNGESALSDWHVEKRIDELKTGLNARMFVNDKTHEINISFEGSHGFTKLLAENALDARLLKDLYTYSDGFTRFLTPNEYDMLYKKWFLVLGNDGVADLQMMANKVPDQFYTAYKWFNDTMDVIKKSADLSSYHIVITGHSLGGSMAQLVSAKYYLDTNTAIPTMAIDGTGVLTLLEQIQGYSLNTKDFSHIINFCTEGDPVGEFASEGHLGFTVPMPYDLARGDRPGELPNYRIFLEAFQKATGIENIRLDRHEMGQQIDLFDGTRFSYPENRVMLGAAETVFRSTSATNEIIMGNNLGNEIYGSNYGAYIVGGSGNDLLVGGLGDDFISGGAGNDKIFGGAGNNILYGGDGDDYLEGGRGNDELYGGKGNDTLVWTGGNDSLYGQGGNNQYILGKTTDNQLSSGTVTLKFDRENAENANVLVNTSAIDLKNSAIVFLMSDQILPSHTLVSQKDNSLYIKYDQYSSITIENWSNVQNTIGSNITFQFLGSDKMQYSIQNNQLVRR